MAFKPADDFSEVWTTRVTTEVKPRLLAYNFGNSSGESIIRTNKGYHVATRTATLLAASRDRDGSTGALADFADPTSDALSISWQEVVATGNQNWSAHVDQRDINYSGPASLGFLRMEIADGMREWVDAHIWSQVEANIPAANVTGAVDGGAVDYDISDGDFDGGTAAQKTAFWKSYWDWLNSLPLKLANANYDPATGTGDTAGRLAVVQAPAFMKGLREYMIATSGLSPDQIKVENIDTTGIRSRARWRGRLFDMLDLYVATDEQFKPTSAGADNMNVMAFPPTVTWDNAIMAYPLGVSPPDGDSVKWRFNQEVEVWVKVINPTHLYAFTCDAQA